MTSYFNKPCLCDPCQRSKRKRFCHVIFERTDNINQSIWTVLDNILSDSKSDISVAEVLSKISTSSKQSMILKMEIMAPFLNLACGYEFAEILAKELERFNADRFSGKKFNFVFISYRFSKINIFLSAKSYFSYRSYEIGDC